VLDGERTIQRCIDSVRSLKERFGVEHIIVDGGSTDSTLAHVRDANAHIDAVIDDQRRGISAAMNLGIEHANGHFICILNSDDFMIPEGAARILESASLLADGGPEILLGDVLLVEPRRGNIERRVANLGNMSKFMSVYHPAMWVAKKVYARLGGYAESYSYAMDCEFVHRALAAEVRFHHVADTLAGMCLGGISHRHLGRAMAEFRRSVVYHQLSRRHVAYCYQMRQSMIHFVLRNRVVRDFYLRHRHKHSG